MTEDIVVLCWKDNNTVTGITNAYSATQSILSIRKRPRASSTSGREAHRYFGDEYLKLVAIPLVFYKYNNNMNGGDINNQLRSGFTV